MHVHAHSGEWQQSSGCVHMLQGNLRGRNKRAAIGGKHVPAKPCIVYNCLANLFIQV